MIDGSTRELLRQGDIGIIGRMPFASNATFLVEAVEGERRTRGVYKPGRGERPLWDFPDRLYRREVAAYELSDALGWGLVPFTILRDGPLGEGSVQAFVEADFEEHYFTLCEQPDLHDQLKRICVFDLLANNTDRKGGHCLLGRDGRLYAIDNALCFHTEFKLRTVIWEFAGQPIPEPLLADIARLVESGPPPAMAGLLDADEQASMLERGAALLAQPRFPHDPSGRRYPWPMV
jgi:uncharacterized repeat protein (TIGR03843 family)